MIVAGSANPLLLASAAGGYNLTNSLRFRGSASASLTRTPASSGNKRTFTYSGWVKRGSLTGTPNILSATDGTTTDDYFRFTRTSDDCTLNFATYDGTIQYRIQSTAVYRDPSAWYHVVLRVDTTQATASNRYRIYVNGSQITSFSFATYPPQNYELTALNNNVLQRIGSSNFDGYMTEVNFIDGQSLDPSSFGETNAKTGVWQPKRYAGTYGTNGFYLPFTDNSALTTSSNVGLGKDFSGNGNYWTTNNISITAGVTYDSMTDVPTLTSATASNFAVLNPLQKNSGVLIIDGNLSIPSTGGTGSQEALSTIAFPSLGKWYAEYNCTTVASTANCGIISYLNGAERTYQQSGNKFSSSGGSTSYGASWGAGDIIGIALDIDNGTLTFYKNGVSQGVAFTDITSGFANTTFNFKGSGSQGVAYSFNFGQRPFAYTPPTGFVALNTFNLPTPTIGATASTQANKYMDISLYTGNGSTQTVTNSNSMQPDFVWIKSRSSAGFAYILQDSVRGAGKSLISNSISEELGNSGELVGSFNSNGFQVNTTFLGGSNNSTNGSGSTFVSWQWRASNATAVSNTAGSVSSTVSANTSAGFSIVTYTGNQTNGTVGHGLGVAPRMIIVKNRSTSDNNWFVYHASLGATQRLILNSTAASVTTSLWRSTAPTSTVFSVAADSDVNGSGANYVAYCFAQVAGYSSIGSYTGNGSSDGPFIYTGFKPRYIMVKVDAVYDWIVWDSARNTFNVTNSKLSPNTIGAEFTDTSAVGIDFLSNGFKLRGTDNSVNTSSGSYLYMAFAESPFKYSLAD